jgi:D-glycero-D-manno-heptose 1,7-bisphosphate phosphatase
LRPGLILDRDGVINLDTEYLYRIEECRFVEGIFELAAAFRDRGFRLAIATNQSGIGRGLYGPAEFRTLMGWMLAQFGARGVAIDAVYHAPENPLDGEGTPWRKPGPGMLLQAIADLDLDPVLSWSIGDKPRDMAAAKAAGIGQAALLDPEAPAVTRHSNGYWVVPSLTEARSLLDRI